MDQDGVQRYPQNQESTWWYGGAFQAMPLYVHAMLTHIQKAFITLQQPSSLFFLNTTPEKVIGSNYLLWKRYTGYLTGINPL